MADDSSDNAFSFAGHAAAPAAGTQSNSSQSIDTGGSENSELRTQVPRRALVAPRGRLPTIPAIEDADNTSGKRRSSERQLSSEAYILESAFTDSGRYTIGDRIIQKVSAPSPGSDLFTAYQDELTEYKISLDKATEEKSVLQVRLHEMAAYANQQFNSLERPRVKRWCRWLNNYRSLTPNSSLLSGKTKGQRTGSKSWRDTELCQMKWLLLI